MILALSGRNGAPDNFSRQHPWIYLSVAALLIAFLVWKNFSK